MAISSIQRILVAVDFSPTSDAARDYAMDLAEKTGASVELLHVFQWPVYAVAVDTGHDPTAALIDGVQAQLAATLEHQKEACGRPQVHVRTTMRKGVPHETILDQAEKSDADLIVLGTRGRTGLSHALLGSVAERVIRLARVPVLTIGQRAREELLESPLPRAAD